MSRHTKRHAKRRSKRNVQKLLLGIDILVIICGLIGIYYLFCQRNQRLLLIITVSKSHIPVLPAAPPPKGATRKQETGLVGCGEL